MEKQRDPEKEKGGIVRQKRDMNIDGGRREREVQRQALLGPGPCPSSISLSAEGSGPCNEPWAPLHMLTLLKIRSIYLQPAVPAASTPLTGG